MIYYKILIIDFGKRGYEKRVQMEKVMKNMKLINRLKWLGIVLGAVMCVIVQSSFGNFWAVVSGTVSGLAYIYICERGKRSVLSDHIADDIHQELSQKGFDDCIIEIKLFRLGVLIRIYTLNAGENILRYNAAILSKLKNSWYKEKIWVTQLIDVKDRTEIASARNKLDTELINDIKKMNK